MTAPSFSAWDICVFLCFVFFYEQATSTQKKRQVHELRTRFLDCESHVPHKFYKFNTVRDTTGSHRDVPSSLWATRKHLSTGPSGWLKKEIDKHAQESNILTSLIFMFILIDILTVRTLLFTSQDPTLAVTKNPAPHNLTNKKSYPQRLLSFAFLGTKPS